MDSITKEIVKNKLGQLNFVTSKEYHMEGAYGRWRLYANHMGSEIISPSLTKRGLYDWMMAYLQGYRDGHDQGYDRASEMAAQEAAGASI